MRFVSFEVCSRYHHLQVIVLEGLPTFLYGTRDIVPTIRSDLYANMMFDTGFADIDLNQMLAISCDGLSQSQLRRYMVRAHFAVPGRKDLAVDRRCWMCGEREL